MVATLITAVTSRIGIVPTFAYPPYLLARLIASLDQVSAGRIGWNMVTGSSDWAARNFGLDGLVPALQRRGLVRRHYEHAQFRDNLLAF